MSKDWKEQIDAGVHLASNPVMLATVLTDVAGGGEPPRVVLYFRNMDDMHAASDYLRNMWEGSVPETPAEPDPGFQGRVYDWMAGCFVRPDALLLPQRSFRFIEEALELVQASGTGREDVLRLVEYVYGRPAGSVAQEIGGVMVTLAGLSTSAGLSMSHAANAELARCRENTETIRAKDLAKPQRSPLPGSSEKAEVPHIMAAIEQAEECTCPDLGYYSGCPVHGPQVKTEGKPA
jgi:hypothetical protein